MLCARRLLGLLVTLTTCYHGEASFYATRPAPTGTVDERQRLGCVSMLPSLRSTLPEISDMWFDEETSPRKESPLQETGPLYEPSYEQEPSYDRYGSPDQLRGGDLNELLQPDHLEQLLYANYPLQAYGALFKWDVLIDDVVQVYKAPWLVVAKDNDLLPPDDEDVLRATSMRPERAIQQAFLWTSDWGFTQQLAFEHFEASRNSFRTQQFTPSVGAKEWLAALNKYGVPCCLCSTLTRESAEFALEQAGLREYFQHLVTAEDGCETAEQTYLVSCVKLKRPPEKCVVFEDDPRGVVAAHDALTKVVAIAGRHMSSDLRHADVRVSGLDDLSLMMLREIFKAV